MKDMKVYFRVLHFLLIAAVFVPTKATAQFEKIATLSHSSVHLAAVDRPGDLYVISHDSVISRYDLNGKLQQKGSMPLLPEIFDPHDGARLFAFDIQTRRYVYFTPSFTFQDPPSRPDSVFAIDPVFVCASGDRDLIILDSADRSLKKIDLKAQRLLFESVLPDSTIDFLTLKSIREYQNFIFMLDAEKGILIFNMLGRLLKTIPAKGIAYFSFLGEELYYPENNSLRFFNLFSTESRTVNLPYAARFALLTDERLYLVGDAKTDIFSVKP